jgi:hypothetical protein
MSVKIIPLNTAQPFETLKVELEGHTFEIQKSYNSRSDRYYLSFFDSDGVAIVHGIKAVVGVPLLRKDVAIAKPSGEFYCFDTTGANVEAGEGELGDRVLLCYQEST